MKIQITGRHTYTRMQQRIGIPLLAQPELAQQPAIAARILAGNGQWLNRKTARANGSHWDGALLAALVARISCAIIPAAVYYNPVAGSSCDTGIHWNCCIENRLILYAVNNVRGLKHD